MQGGSEERTHQLAKVGIEVKINLVDQTTLVSDAIAGNYEAMTFRRHMPYKGLFGGHPILGMWITSD